MANNQLTNYITTRRQQGVNDEQIIKELVDSRWNEQIVRSAMGQKITITPHQEGIVPPPTIASTTPALPVYQSTSNEISSKIHKYLIIFLSIMLGLLIVWIIYALANPHKPPTETMQIEQKDLSLELFLDTNFEMQIPKSWSGDASYKPGAPTILFYSPEDTSDANRHKASQLAIHVLQKSRGETIDTRPNGIYRDLEYEKAQLTKIRDEKVAFGEQEGRIVELNITSPERPESNVRYVTASILKGDVIYFLDVRAPDEFWSLHEEAVNAMISSFRPKSSTLF
jgi:hypothetical protein